jgi:CheY-like chemotaxis protein
MNRQGRILVVDDLAKWREQLVETLEEAGFYAHAVSSIPEMLQQLEKTFYHILVLDICLVENDETNEEGIRLLRELDNQGLSEAIKVIVLSAYGTQERMRLAFRDHKVVDFLSKDEFSIRSFLESIRQAFVKEPPINLSLEVHWQQAKGSEQTIDSLVIGGRHIKWHTILKRRLRHELDDLLCRLFSQSDSILVKRLSLGRSGAGVLRVEPFFKERGGQEIIVKFGDASQIQAEYRNFKEHVESFIGEGRSTAVRYMRRTTHLEGITYTFLGTDSRQLIDFSHFYSKAKLPDITHSLDQLFLGTCHKWYTNRRRQVLDLKEDYQKLLTYTSAKLDRIRSKRLKSVHGKQELRFTSLKEEPIFQHPLVVLSNLPMSRTTYVCTTHGDFNPHNLLVDETGHIWLIDFQSTGQSHIFRDIAMLDTALRFQLLSDKDASIKDRYYLEKALLDNIQHFSQVHSLPTKLATKNPALAKTYATVLHLRRLAHQLVTQNPPTGDDISEYYIALCYTALNTLQFSSLSPTQLEHALLSASLLADRLRSQDEQKEG